MSDVLDSHDNRTITLTDDLDAAQEPNNASDSEATGTATLTITFNPETGEASYSSALSAVGQCEDDLQTPIPDVVSAIHLQNTPAAVNGPVVQDTLTDASAEMDGAVPSGITGLDVIDNTVEVDILSSIENVFGSNDSNVLLGSGGAKALDGADGDDFINGGEGDDIFAFSANFCPGVIKGFEVGIDQLEFSDIGTDATVSQDGADALFTFSDYASLVGYICFLLQDIQFFDGTIRDNFTRFSNNIDDPAA